MAKRKTIDAALDKIFKNYADNVEKAAKKAVIETTDEIKKYAFTCLEEYYNNYDPTSYERTESLQNAILPYNPIVKNDGDNVSSIIGIEYDSSKLDNTYYGSKKYQPVDGEYVLLNYLYGIHPKTDGSSDPETVIYYERWDELYGDDNPWNKMENYLTKKIPDIYRIKLLKHLFK